MSEGLPRPVLGALLAGGRSSRFGSDKAMALLRGKRLLDHAAASVAQHVDALVLCGRSEAGFTCLADRPAADLGPLGGLNAALHHAAAKGFAGVLTSGCDMPLYPAEIAAALIGDRPACLEASPLIGYWPASLAPALDIFIAQDSRRSVRGWGERASARIVDVPGLFLPNLNTAGELGALEDQWDEVRRIWRKPVGC